MNDWYCTKLLCLVKPAVVTIQAVSFTLFSQLLYLMTTSVETKTIESQKHSNVKLPARKTFRRSRLLCVHKGLTQTFIRILQKLQRTFNRNPLIAQSTAQGHLRAFHKFLSKLQAYKLYYCCTSYCLLSHTLLLINTKNKQLTVIPEAGTSLNRQEGTHTTHTQLVLGIVYHLNCDCFNNNVVTFLHPQESQVRQCHFPAYYSLIDSLDR